MKRIHAVAVFVVLVVFPVIAAAPQDWFLAGNRPQDYQVTDEGSAKVLASKRSFPVENGFGTVMRRMPAEQYRGMRLRLAANVRAETVKGWAGVWMRVDGEDRKVLAFDNMQNRPIRGTQDWRGYTVTLDVPENATSISYGVLLAGRGKVWMDDVQFITANGAH